MSFGFSIGDIVLLSQLAYNLYSSVTAASRDLRDLEDVLFSLRCALDHLGDVAKDVLAKAEIGGRQSGPDFKENLNRMIASCGSTLQELDDLMQKYREISADDGLGPKQDTKRMIQRIKVNWKKVRWDQEKQSLQQYREKLRSHTDAINLILTSLTLSQTASAESNNKSNHDKTHSLLEEVLKNPKLDSNLQQMVQDIHRMMVQTVPHASTILPSVGRLHAGGASTGMGYGGTNLSPAMFAMQAATLPSPATMPRSVANQPASRGVFRRVNHPQALNDPLADSVEPSCEPHGFVSAQSTPTQGMVNGVFAYHAGTSPSSSLSVPPSIVPLNNERRAFGVKEFDAFTKRHVRPVRPSFLAVSTPDVVQLQDSLAYIFHPAPNLDEGTASTPPQERISEISRWIEGFRQFVQTDGSRGDQSKALVDLMVTLNEAIEKSDGALRAMFYQASDLVHLPEALERLQSNSKSVRVMKEVEEFQDAREEWDEK
ncbi:hypothetical protein K458DRAFT_438643 [Lentithecium fluviatile CBS 122367]|uniref:Fungal N-terminal domain-containing protein n=1 Tax=Lentithecium fluviatile CBS 122367 TaxID=1168545 RepID=A0A6G1JKX3_9PLEO|nr:hypothetical protein K458DRAFT_438643 [Lentithecium fluviatile CBS 122367]